MRTTLLMILLWHILLQNLRKHGNIIYGHLKNFKTLSKFFIFIKAYLAVAIFTALNYLSSWLSKRLYPIHYNSIKGNLFGLSKERIFCCCFIFCKNCLN